MSIKDDFNSWSKGKKVAAIGGICCIGIIIIFLISSVITPDANTANDDFNGKDARLENVSISSSYGFFSVDGKIMFKYDESYAESMHSLHFLPAEDHISSVYHSAAYPDSTDDN